MKWAWDTGWKKKERSEERWLLLLDTLYAIGMFLILFAFVGAFWIAAAAIVGAVKGGG